MKEGSKIHQTHTSDKSVETCKRATGTVRSVIQTADPSRPRDPEEEEKRSRLPLSAYCREPTATAVIVVPRQAYCNPGWAWSEREKARESEGGADREEKRT